ncbi:UNVERIFIED_CONTAM: hypothetical protein Sradi_0758900 [Sesamum radiatum]|uniref:Retrovirus-related Pol polyprotein from transposon TNT 1-94-like beta-barrel domain-containing protein n=1 Tax=Sesamum radiatum TaxID=300843 RepID=A0AAW2VP76_SESRA
MEMTDTGDNIAMQVKDGFKRDIEQKSNLRRKRQQYCEHCARAGHTKKTRFKIHRTPDWYKELLEQKRKEGGGSGGTLQPILLMTEGCNHRYSHLRRVRGSTSQSDLSHQVNFAQFDDFVGMNSILNSSGDRVLSCWIVDTGATNPMCATPNLLTHLVLSSTPTTVHIPDGSVQAVSHSGIAHLDNNLTLKNVLLVPSFKFNLLSVPKLCSTSSIDVHFHSSHCSLEDRGTKRIIVVGKLLGNLYVLDDTSFNLRTIQSFSTCKHSCFNAKSADHVDLWHK